MQHILIAKEKNSCKIVVADPRRTRTAAKADYFVSLRPGSDVAFIWGVLWHVFKNNWEDKEYIRQRVFGMDEIRAEVAKWTPAEVERVTGVSEEEVYNTAKTLAENRQVVWFGVWAVLNTPQVTTILVRTASLSWRWATSVNQAAVPTFSVVTITCKAQPT